VVEIQITVGRFALRVGSPEGTRADPATEPERRPPKELAEALRKEPSRLASAADAVGAAVGAAEEVTASVERANDLVTAIAKGLTLDPKALEQQVDALLDVLDRADRDGRFEDEIRLARALVGLLALVPRWVALVEVLRRVAVAAAALGDRASEAWAHHELGSFALGAEDGQAATYHLNEALERREALGDPTAIEVTLHNLRLVPLIGTGRDGIGQTIGRHPIVATLVAVAVLATAGGLAIAASRDSNGGSQTAATAGDETATEAPTETSDETTDGGTTTDVGDNTEPLVEIGVPGEVVRQVVTLSATASDAGGSGLEFVTFELAPTETNEWIELGRDAAAPYSLRWDTTTVGDGVYDVRARATDGAQNESDSTPAGAVVDNSSPSVTLGAVADRIAGTVALSAKAEDGAGSGVALVLFQLAPAGSEAWTTVAETDAPVDPEAGPEYAAEFDTTAFADGEYRLRVAAADRVGNLGLSDETDVTIAQPVID
jgi:hypothetical protein